MPEDLKTLKKKVNQALASKDFETAKDALNEILEQTPEDDVAWNNRGIVLSKLGKPKNAILSFDKALEINPKVPQVWYGKGSVLMTLEKYRYALGCFYKVLDLESGNKKAEEKFVECLAKLRGEATAKPAEEKKPEPAKPAQEEEEAEEPSDEFEEPKNMKSQMGHQTLETEVSKKPEPPAKKKESPKTLIRDEDQEYTLPELEAEDMTDVKSTEPVKEAAAPPKKDVSWEEEEEKPAPEPAKPKTMKTINCKCGNPIEVDTSQKPVKFQCSKCGRTGTLGGKKK